MAGPRPTALYRFFNADDQPLYIGIAYNPAERWEMHKLAVWWPLVARNTVDWLPSRVKAERAEIAAIKAEKPLYNRKHAHYHPPVGVSVRELRSTLATVIAEAIAGRSTFITQNGRRVARIAPLAAAQPPATPEQVAAEKALRKHGAELDDFLAACLRAVAATPESVLKSLKPYWPEPPKPPRP